MKELLNDSEEMWLLAAEDPAVTKVLVLRVTAWSRS